MSFIRMFLWLFILCTPLFPEIRGTSFFPSSYAPSDLQKIDVLDVKEVRFKELDNLSFSEISALAYDTTRGLFALSDKGRLFRLEIDIRDLKLNRLELLEAMPLRTKKGEVLKKKRHDSEGMAWTKKGLVISFERDPKVSLFDFKGQKLKNYTLNKSLRDIKEYRKENKALEAVTVHPDFGVITAPESPLKDEDKASHTLYSLHRRWQFIASGEITSIELMPDNNLLVLEREFNLLRGYSITLKKVIIVGCKSQLCPSMTLASLKSRDGWELDNFEGLTHIRDDIYLMISDDNSNPFQKCIAVLFRVKA